MYSVRIARLLEGAPLKAREEAIAGSPTVAAAIGGSDMRDAVAMSMNPQHAIVTGLGAAPRDSLGFLWNGNYIAASGNLLADFRWNLMTESQGNLQVGRHAKRAGALGPGRDTRWLAGQLGWFRSARQGWCRSGH